jgi:5-methylcytosine-specific restriction endonuclease McrA
METAEQTQLKLKKGLENSLIQFRANLIAQPLNENIKKYIKDYEDCLKKYHPDSELIKKPINKPIKDTSNKKKKTTITKKKTIPSTVKKLVWNTNVGEEIGKTKCLCCKSTDITQMSFNCGHIIAEVNGGNTIVSNLKPICQNCNSSMGTKNMNEFMLSLK